jgi:hypothetical protein
MSVSFANLRLKYFFMLARVRWLDLQACHRAVTLKSVVCGGQNVDSGPFARADDFRIGGDSTATPDLELLVANAIDLPGDNWSMHSPMTVEEVRALVSIQSAGNLNAVNDHRIALKDALIAPRTICVIARQVKNGRMKDENLTVWLVGQEDRPDGYKIVLREDGMQVGLASNGFPHDKALIMDGWYGDLLTTFLGM